jgi:hypothetical protein
MRSEENQQNLRRIVQKTPLSDFGMKRERLCMKANVLFIVTIHYFSNLSPDPALLVHAAMVLKNENRQDAKGAKEETLRLGSIFFCRATAKEKLP